MEDDLSQFYPYGSCQCLKWILQTEGGTFPDEPEGRGAERGFSLCESEFGQIHLLFTEKYARLSWNRRKCTVFCTPVWQWMLFCSQWGNRRDGKKIWQRNLRFWKEFRRAVLSAHRQHLFFHGGSRKRESWSRQKILKSWRRITERYSI